MLLWVAGCNLADTGHHSLAVHWGDWKMRTGIDVVTFPSWSAAAAPSSPQAHTTTALEHKKKVIDYFAMCLASFRNSHTPHFIASRRCVTVDHTRPGSGQKTTPGYDARGVQDSSLGVFRCALTLVLFYFWSPWLPPPLIHNPDIVRKLYSS